MQFNENPTRSFTHQIVSANGVLPTTAFCKARRQRPSFNCLFALLIGVWSLTISGCGQTESSSGTTVAGDETAMVTSAGASSIEFDPDKPSVSALFLGNSHSSPIPPVLTELFAQHCPSVQVKFHKAASSGFLVEQARSDYVKKEITQSKWDYVVLQAQKYSTTGKYSYPTDGAVALAELAKKQGAKVILYPEFPREGVDEYSRIRAIHESIAEKTGATVAPIGEAWSLAAEQVGESTLYAGDGNHASQQGSYVVASVFFRMLSPESSIESPEAIKFEKLFQAATQAVAAELTGKETGKEET